MIGARVRSNSAPRASTSCTTRAAEAAEYGTQSYLKVQYLLTESVRLPIQSSRSPLPCSSRLYPWCTASRLTLGTASSLSGPGELLSCTGARRLRCKRLILRRCMCLSCVRYVALQKRLQASYTFASSASASSIPRSLPNRVFFQSRGPPVV